MPEPPPRKGISLGGLFETVVCVSLLGTWLPSLGRWIWWLGLGEHFRMQMAVASLAACVLFTWRKSWKVAAFALLCVGRNTQPLGAICLAAPLPETSEQPSVRAIVFNVLTTNERRTETLAYLQQANADIICLLEVSPEWLKALEPLHTTHPHTLQEPRWDNFGVALYSRLPLSQARVHGFTELGLPCIDATVDAGGGQFRFIGAHPLPPTEKDALGAMAEQMRAIAAEARASKLPMLVAGDFNATPWSIPAQDLVQDSPLTLVAGPGTLRPTWQARSIFMIPIDLTYVSAPLCVTSREIGPDLGSDHRPQELTMRWRK
jgi:endonuclease/exonuclease/phosphatase (EEP) superfamily protein YafD